METTEITAEIANVMAKQAIQSYLGSLRQDIIYAANEGKFEMRLGYGMSEIPEVISYCQDKGFKIFKNEENGSQRTYISWESK